MKPWLLWMAGLLLGGIAVIVAAPRAIQARESAEAETGRLARVSELAARIRRSEARPGYRASRVDLNSSLPERLAACVAAAGLPTRVLESVSPGPGSSVEGPMSITRLQTSVCLAGLTLPELGRVLDRWRTSEPVWVVSGIVLTPEPNPKVEPGADLTLRVNLNLEGLTTGEDR